MKKIFIFLASIVLLTACGGSKEENGGGGGGGTTTPTITFGAGVNTSPVLGTEGGSVDITFTASDAWTAGVINTRADSWVSVSPTSGAKGSGKITIKAAANDTPDERGATIQIKSGTTTKSISLTQKQKDAFTATASKTELGKDGGNFTIEVKANVSFTYTIDKGSEWIKYISTKALKTSTITFEASKNNDTERRDGKITVTSSAGNESFTIYQEGSGPTIILSSSTASVPDTGGEFTVDVTHNVDVTVKIQDGITWLRENGSKAVSTNSYKFVVDANEGTDSREADIYFQNTANGLSEKVHVVQAQKNAIVIAQKDYEIPADGGNFTVAVGHNVDITIEISDSWITQVTTRAMVNENIVYSVSKNETGSLRTGTVTFKSGDLQQVVTVKQPSVPYDPSSVNPGFFGLEGLSWTFDKKTDQIFIKGSTSGEFNFALIKPETNKFAMISTVVNGDPTVGMAVNASIMQNFDNSKPNVVEQVVLVVTKVEGDYLWASTSTASDKYVIVKYK